MFRYNTTGTSSNNEVSKYVDGYDIHNSRLLRELDDPSLNRVSYLITKYEYRPDLIAEDIYGDRSYCSILMHQARMSLSGYVRGVVIRVVPKNDVDKIIREI